MYSLAVWVQVDVKCPTIVIESARIPSLIHWFGVDAEREQLTGKRFDILEAAYPTSLGWLLEDTAVPAVKPEVNLAEAEFDYVVAVLVGNSDILVSFERDSVAYTTVTTCDTGP